MARKILRALAAISFLLTAFSLSGFAQELQFGGGLGISGYTWRESRLAVSAIDSEEIRRNLLTAYDESDALMKYLAAYEIVRQSEAIKDYDAVRQSMEDERLRIQQMTPSEFSQYLTYLPYTKNLTSIIQLSRSIRADAKFQAVLQKAERYWQAGLLNGKTNGNGLNARSVVAAPAYITPNCDFTDPSNYPSGVDLGIANGVALALRTLVEVQPTEMLIFCTTIPNPFRAITAVLSGIADQVANALKAVAVDGAYCESIRLYVEEQLTPDGGQNALLMGDDFYLTFMYRSVRAAMTSATSTGVPTNCGLTRLTEASAYFDGSDNFNGASGADRVNAFKKLRAAYQNIGASACVQ